MVTDGNRIGRLGAGGQDAGARQPLDATVEADVDAERLREQRSIQAAGVRSTLDQVKERPSASYGMRLTPGIKYRAFKTGNVLEIEVEAQMFEEIQYV